MQETVGEKTKTGGQLPDRSGDGRKKKKSLEKNVATELLKLAMETEKERNKD